MAESEREEEKEVIFEVMLAWRHEMLHGYPMGNNDVSLESQLSSNPLGLGYWAENIEEKKEIWAFCS